MKAYYLIPVVAIIGIVTLFFFPEPESNFAAYAATALFFFLLTIAIIAWQIKTWR